MRHRRTSRDARASTIGGLSLPVVALGAAAVGLGAWLLLKKPETSSPAAAAQGSDDFDRIQRLYAENPAYLQGPIMAKTLARVEQQLIAAGDLQRAAQVHAIEIAVQQMQPAPV